MWVAGKSLNNAGIWWCFRSLFSVSNNKFAQGDCSDMDMASFWSIYIYLHFTPNVYLLSFFSYIMGYSEIQGSLLDEVGDVLRLILNRSQLVYGVVNIGDTNVINIVTLRTAKETNV